MRPNALSFFLLFLCLCLGKAYGQRQNVYFFKEHGKKVSTRDSADFVRIVSEPDSGTRFYNVKEYYKNGVPKFIGKSSKIDPLVLEGECMAYYPSGKKQSFVKYTLGIPDGDAYYFFPNGKLYTYKKFILEKPASNSFRSGGILIMASNDSTGKELVIEGNGRYIGYGDANKSQDAGPMFFTDNIVNYDFNTIAAEGDIKAGLKDGQWKSIYISGKNEFTLTEYYENGRFISGESVNKDGQVVKYTIKMQEPKYPGGTIAFNMFLGQNVKYPEEARRSGIQGKVYVSFTIERDGAVTEVRVEKSPNPLLGAAAVAAVKQSPAWIPGYENGRPVRVRYTVPVNFTLGSPGR